MSPMHPFDEAMALQPQADGSFAGRTHAAWANMIGPYGGITAAQCLQAVLTAELVDGAAWELLQAMAEDFEYEDLADDFAQATRQEALHLEQIRAWHEQAVLQTGHRHADRAPR